MKQGKSGRFALMKFEHRIYVGADEKPVVTEQRDYVLREAARPDAGSTPAAEKPQTTPPQVGKAHLVRTIVPDEMMNFRYSSITDNPHRIHYDFQYTTKVEGYPGLVVSGGIPVMFLLEVFRITAAREPVTFDIRNLAPMFCGRPLHLFAHDTGEGWRLWAQDDTGNPTVEARAT